LKSLSKFNDLQDPLLLNSKNSYFKTLFGFKNFSRLVQKLKQSRTFKDLWSPCK